MVGWRSFSTLLEQPQVHEFVDGTGEVTVSLEGAVASSENLSRIVYDELLPYSEVAHEALTKVLVEECDLWVHVNAMEDLFLMRRGDAMSHFVDVLFRKVGYSCIHISTLCALTIFLGRWTRANDGTTSTS